MKKQTLTEALALRDSEIEHYAINIENYQRALQTIAAEHSGDSEMDAAMQAFAEQLRELLRTSLIEQRKAQIIRDVIAAQINEME